MMYHSVSFDQRHLYIPLLVWADHSMWCLFYVYNSPGGWRRTWWQLPILGRFWSEPFLANCQPNDPQVAQPFRTLLPDCILERKGEKEEEDKTEKELGSSEDSHTCLTLYKHSATTQALRAEPKKPLRPTGGKRQDWGLSWGMVAEVRVGQCSIPRHCKGSLKTVFLSWLVNLSTLFAVSQALLPTLLKNPSPHLPLWHSIPFSALPVFLRLCTFCGLSLPH